MAALLSACGDLTLPEEETLATADLLILGLQTQAPQPTGATFFVSNARRTVRRLIHDDGFNTPYVELAFPPGSIAAVSGTELGSNDSVQVTVTPRGGQYGITLSPAGLSFSPNNAPTITFFFATYADLQTLSDSDRYARWLEYVAALELWEEITPDLWRRVSGSTVTASDAATGSVEAPGTYVVAAPR